MLGSWYAYAATSKPDDLPYDLSFWRAGASTVGTALSAWFAHRRSKAAIPVAAVTAVSTVALGVVNKLKAGAYVTRTWPVESMREKAFNRAMPIAHVAGSAALAAVGVASALKRKATGTAPIPGPLLKEPWYPQARKWGLYFMAFSMLGHWAEMLLCTAMKYGIIKGGYDRENRMLWDQWLFPFPAEGTAAVLADALLVPAKRSIQSFVNARAATGLIAPALATPIAVAASFFVNQLVCTSIDFMTGMVANRNYELWDYRDMRFHFMGQICLQNSLIYSVIATWAVWRLLPVLEKAMARVGDTALDGLLVGSGSFFVFLELLYQVLPFGKGSDALSE